MDSEAPRFLLLLPPAGPQPSAADLRSTYGETIREVLKEVASHSSDSASAAVLEIALACDFLVDASSRPRSALYAQTQHTLAGVYRLVCVLAAEDNVNVEDADGVDVRIILVAWSANRPTATSLFDAPYGPVVDIFTLAKCGRPWQFAFGVETELGGSMVRAFIQAKGSDEDTSRGSGPSSPPQTTSTTDTSHYHVAVGGTFDHLHIGHKLLLTMTLFAVDTPPPSTASPVSRSATIGITGDQLLVKKKHADLVESWESRQHAVAAFIDSLINFTTSDPEINTRNEPGPNGKSIDITYPDGLTIKCTEIQDPFGPTITEEQISALVISAETRAGGAAVNEKRKEKSWKELEVFEVDVLDASAEGEEGVKGEFENKLSSTAIREKLAKKAADKI